MLSKTWQQELQSAQAYAEIVPPGESRAHQTDNPVKLATARSMAKKNTREANSFSNKVKQSQRVQDRNQ